MWLSVGCAILAGWLLSPTPMPTTGVGPALPASRRLLSLRPVAALGAGLAVWGLIGGPMGPMTGAIGAVVAWRVLAQAEPAAVRREREAVARELPHLVDLFGSTLRAGVEPLAGLAAVCQALPGPAATRLSPVLEQSRWGAAPHQAWDTVAQDPALALLARAMIRSESSGASVVDVVERLADELEGEALASAEDAARRVGVAAAVPLGVCLLPAFLLIGVVPTVASLLSSIAL